MPKRQIAVIGDGNSVPTSPEWKLAYEIGAEIAKVGGILICGGGGGIMEASCRGSKDHGGITIGILPGISAREVEYLDIQIPTGLNHARNALVALSADLIISIGGKAGTLSEMCFGWIYGKPIIALSNVSGWSIQLAGHCLDDRSSIPIYAANNSSEVKQLLEKILKIR